MLQRLLAHHRFGVYSASVVVFLAAAGGATPSPRATSKIPGCAPQCLPRSGFVPGSLPTGKYKTKYFFVGR